MILETSSLREMSVSSQDGKKVGKIANLLFSVDPRNIGRAKVLVFPDVPILSRKEILKIALEAGSDAATSLLPEGADKPVEIVIDTAGDTANAVLSKNEIKKLLQFYLFPPEFIAAINENKKEAHLNQPFSSLQTYTFENKKDIPQIDSYVAFFAGSVPEAGRFWTRSLNLTSLQCYPIYDPQGNDGEIIGLKLDTSTCKVTHFVVSPGNHLVSLGDFDFQSMSCKRPIVECQPA